LSTVYYYHYTYIYICMFSRFIHRLDNILLLISYYVSTKKDSSPKYVIFQTPRDYMTVQVYYIRRTYNSMSNDYNIIHLNWTSGGYQSDNLTRMTAVIVATRHKQLLCTYVRKYKESENINPRECVSAGFILQFFFFF